MNVQDIEISKIYSDPDFNCRGYVNPQEVVDLARNIEQNGLQQPIVVRPYGRRGFDYVVVMGHRRFQAFKNLKRLTIPCSIRTDLTESQAQTLNIIENVQRKDLTFMQEARAVGRLAANHFTQQQIASMLNTSQGWVAQRVMALKLPEDIQQEVDAGFIKASEIRALLDIPSRTHMYETVRELKETRLRGEKRRIRIAEEKTVVNEEKKRSEKRPRSVSEMFELQDKIYEKMGNGFPTRILGWAGGLVSNEEILADLDKYAAAQ